MSSDLRFKYFLLFFFFLLQNGCKKDVSLINDIRKSYVGAYHFNIIRERWRIDSLSTYDTLWFDGHIKTYAEGDNSKDLSFEDASTENNEAKLTIEFLDKIYITPEISANGIFKDKHGFHYTHTGGFACKTSLKFSVGALGGLGGGTNYNVTGIRK